jgi:Na+/proline symporter
LLLLRVVLVTFTMSALVFALNSTSTMYEMVQNAYNVTLVGAFVPLTAGAFWRRANTQGALASVLLGIGTWITFDMVGPEDGIPSNLLGLAASALGMLMGSLAPQIIANKGHSIESTIHHAAAAAHKHDHAQHGGHGHHGH